MTFIFLTNFINHHQLPLADELYKVLGNKYVYVAFEPLPDWLKKGGYQELERPYIIRAHESDEAYNKVIELINDSDIVMIGSAPEKLVFRRKMQNKITFNYAERWFRDGYYHLLSPRVWRHTLFRNKRSYMLCASAYTASDVSMFFAYPNKCFKWGYFTEVPELDIQKSLCERRSSTLKILWVARFLKLKHPERMLQLGQYLKEKGYDFEINMIGGGELFESIKTSIESSELIDCIHLLGNFPNPQVHEIMRQHHILCFTSDKNEGWGAVLNEGMSNGCCPVGSNEIGSVPFLISSGVNGLIYNSNSAQSLFEKVEYLINHPEKRERMAIAAYQTMKNVWSPHNAATNLISLCSSLLADQKITIIDGPCSAAQNVKSRDFI